jgi:transposase
MTNSITWVGIDDAANKLDVAIFQDQDENPKEEFEVMNDPDGLGRFVKKLKSQPGHVRCAYEAGVLGYTLQRYLEKKGISCAVVAPSLTPRRPGDRIKTNKRDARKLAKLYRAGELTSIQIPTEKQEALRDLIRAREDVLEDLTRQRHRLSKFLLRNGLRYRVGKAWSKGYWEWIRNCHFEDANRQLTLTGYRRIVEHTQEDLKTFDEAVEELAGKPEFVPTASRLMALKGVKEITAMTVIAEAIDLKRYVSASAFMDSNGLVPSENSTGDRERRGSITKTGNSHLRRVLVESAWHYRHPATTSYTMKQRRKGLPEEVVRIAEKADRRLHKKYSKIVYKGKLPTIAVVAVARELAGFVWAIGQVA